MKHLKIALNYDESILILLAEYLFQAKWRDKKKLDKVSPLTIDPSPFNSRIRMSNPENSLMMQYNKNLLD